MCCNINELLARADVYSPEALLELWQPSCVFLIILFLEEELPLAPEARQAARKQSFSAALAGLPCNVLMC